MHLSCLLIPFDFQQMDRALDQSMCKQHHLLCIVLDEGWIQSEKFLLFQMPSDRLVPGHQVGTSRKLLKTTMNCLDHQNEVI